MRLPELQQIFKGYTATASPEWRRAILPRRGKEAKSTIQDYTLVNTLLAEIRRYRGIDFDITAYHSIDELYNLVPKAVTYRLKAFTPCIPYRYEELNLEEKKNCFESSDWVATEKIDGIRLWITITPNGRRHAYARYYNEDCTLVDMSNNILQTTGVPSTPYIIDCEAIFNPIVDLVPVYKALDGHPCEGKLNLLKLLNGNTKVSHDIQKQIKDTYGVDLIEFKLIAPLHYNGEDYLGKTIGEGLDVYSDCVSTGHQLGLNLTSVKMCDGPRIAKEVFLDSLLINGGEGVVFHNRKGTYCTSQYRSRRCFVKLKHSISSELSYTGGIGDTIDAYVSGFNVGPNGTKYEGIINTFKMSIRVNSGGIESEREIAEVPVFDREIAMMATWYNADGLYPMQWTNSKGCTYWVSLNPEYDKMVGELDGESFSSRTHKLIHPKLVCWRPDKTYLDTSYTQAWIDTQSRSNS